jgi:hypothetical protein
MFLILSAIAGAVVGVVAQDKVDFYGYVLRAIEIVRELFRK